VSVALPSLRPSEEAAHPEVLQAQEGRALFNPTIDLATSLNRSPAEQVNSAGGFPRDGTRNIPDARPVSRDARVLLDPGRTGRFHRRFSRWEGP
jgi:hypothetical protein